MMAAIPTSETYAGETAIEPIRRQTSTTTTAASQLVGRGGTSRSEERRGRKPAHSRRPISQSSPAAVIAAVHAGGSVPREASSGQMPAASRITRSKWSSLNGRRGSKKGSRKKRQNAYHGKRF